MISLRAYDLLNGLLKFPTPKECLLLFQAETIRFRGSLVVAETRTCKVGYRIRPWGGRKSNRARKPQLRNLEDVQTHAHARTHAHTTACAAPC